ncbi:MAG TPA: alanyl-tRNA editing protein [Candidatus Eisenbacteria bacterium]|nr:alanyl-tRNA editing protein [Candidatus Eisenbacteria bacterium]
MRPYYSDPYTTRFIATVTGRREDERGPWVKLDHSYFYPESGGQEADRGALSGVAVLDVQDDDTGDVWHLVAGPVPNQVEAEIHAERRHSNRRQHTGQHILSQAFIRLLGAGTLSSRLGDDIGTVDLEHPNLSWEDVDRVERATNQVIWENREVTSHIVDAKELDRFPMRKLPAVEGPVRLVVIDDWDVSPCGGTHCTRTGEVGLVKVRRWERFKGGVRVEFVCGDRALRDYARRVRELVEAAGRRGTGDSEVLDVLERAAAERDDLRKQLKRLGEELAKAESASLAAAHRDSGEAVLLRAFDDRPADELRALCRALTQAGVQRVVLATRGPSPFVIAGRPRDDKSFDMRTILPALKEAAGGRGGGGPDEIQAPFPDGESAARAAERLVEEWRRH